MRPGFATDSVTERSTAPVDEVASVRPGTSVEAPTRAGRPSRRGVAGGLAVRSVGLLVLLGALAAAILASLAFGSKPLRCPTCSVLPRPVSGGW